MLDPRPKGAIYEDDDITVLKNLGEKTEGKLEVCGITSVKSFCSRSLDLKDLSVRSKISEDTLKQFQTEALSARGGSCPAKIDWRKFDDPFVARYGGGAEAEKVRILRSRGSVCVTEMVTHMVDVSHAGFSDTKYSDSWMFYHDALSLMTAKSCIEWMKLQKIGNRTYYDCWLLPTHGCNAEHKRYAGRPVGDRPEVMAWDCHLNKYVDDAVAHHVSVTCNLTDDDVAADGHKLQFSRATPSVQTQAYLRIMDPETGVSPTPKQIVHDMTRAFTDHLRAIYDAKGTVVPGLGNLRYGRRAVVARAGMEKQSGGARPKEAKAIACHALHIDAEGAEKRRFERSQKRFRGVVD